MNALAATAVLAIVIGAFILAGLLSGPEGSANPTAVIHDGKGRVHTLPLEQDNTLTITTDQGSNLVAVKDREVYVSEADCEGQDCVHQGRISSPGRQIVCLPHRLWIEVVSDGGSQEGAREAGAAGGAVGGETEGAYDTIGR